MAIINVGDKVEILDKNTSKVIDSFTARENFCDKMLRRYLCFKLDKTKEEVTIIIKRG